MSVDKGKSPRATAPGETMISQSKPNWARIEQFSLKKETNPQPRGVSYCKTRLIRL